MEIYLDNSATTRCYESAAKLMYELMTEHYGNTSSMHQRGVEAERYRREAAKLIARSPQHEGGGKGDLFYLRRHGER